MAILVIGLLYYFYVPCNARIVECCLTTKVLKVTIEGKCKGSLEIRILGPDTENLVYTVENVSIGGPQYLNVSLPSMGNYTLELVYKGHILDRVKVPAQLMPFIMNAKAELFPNGTMLLVHYQTETTPCFPDYGVKKIDVLVLYSNGTTRQFNFTGDWKPGENIKLVLPVKLNPLTLANMYVELTDSLGNKAQATVLIPR